MSMKKSLVLNDCLQSYKNSLVLQFLVLKDTYKVDRAFLLSAMVKQLDNIAITECSNGK